MTLRICTASLLLVMFLSGCAAVNSMDGWNHFAFSAAVSSVGTAASSKPVGAAGVTFALGLAKETYDHFRGTGFSWKDLLFDLSGSLAGGYAAGEICMEDFP
ncbi:MAG TPA: hypothetical protein PK991_05280 [Candidatus Sabulitectum sp.]|nr:hypothetical protein [Candidatus Sabulitectum sp.]HPR22094.1 hypothetical protein [Candidatus Sabulitectum sp.]